MLKDVIIANKVYAKLSLSDAQEMDDIAVKVIRQDLPNFVLPFKVIDIDGETELRYEIGDGMRLNYLPESMTKSELLILLENMLRPFKECNDWLLDYHNFHLDKNYIIVGKDYLNVKYVYIPSPNYKKSDAEMLSFIEDVVWGIALKDDPVFLMNLCRRIKDKQTTLFSLLEYVSQELGGNTAFMTQEPVAQEPQNNMGGAPFAGAKEDVQPEAKKSDASFLNKFGFGGNTANQQNMAPTPAQEPVPDTVVSYKPTSGEFGKEDIQSSLIGNLFGPEDDAPKKKPAKEPKEPKEAKPKKEKKPFSLFGSGKDAEKASQPLPPNNFPQNNYNYAPYPNVAPQQPQQPAPSYQEPADSFNSNATQIIGMDDFAGGGNKLILQLEEDGGYPFPRAIELDFSNRNYFVIGRYDKSGIPQADYNFEAAFSFISRRHLRIEKNGDQFIAVDLNSGNGSMVNNDLMVSNMPYVVQAGDRIIFSKVHRISYRIR